MGKAVAGGPDEAVAGGLGRHNSCADKPGGTTGEQDRLSNPGFQCRGNKASKPLTETPVGVEVAAGETPSLTGEFVGETHRVLEHIQTTHLGVSHRGPNLIVGSRGSD